MYINTMILGTSQSERVKLIQLMKSQEEQSRKEESLRQTEIYNDRLEQYVREYLEGRFSRDTVQEMPIVASVNLSKRIVKNEASIYCDEPIRTFSNLEDKQQETVELVYKDMRANDKLAHSNASYKLQMQNHVMIVPHKGKLQLRSLRNHHVTAIQDPSNPEEASGYVISSFDKFSLIRDERFGEEPVGGKGRSMRSHTQQSDGDDQGIGDPDDYQAAQERHLVWTKQHNFIMNGKGDIISLNDMDEPDVENPIEGTIPIVDISGEKDFEYWVRQGNNLTEFTIEYNGALSSLGQIVSLQGFAQAYIKGPKGSLPNNVQIGPNYILHLEVDPASDSDTEFGFANPNSDLAGSIQYVEMVLSNYLTSRGLDPKLISGTAQSQQFTSGTERLLAMIDKFEATREDFQLYERVEDQMYNIIKAWLNAYSRTENLNEKYWVSEIKDDSELSVTYSAPEMTETMADKVTRMKDMVDAGFAHTVHGIMEIHDMDKEQAEEMYQEIQEMEGFGEGDQDDNIMENKDIKKGSIPEDQA